MRYGYLLPTRGVVMGSDGPVTLAAKVDSDVVGLARRAESMGFSSVWVGDSVLAKPRLDPFATLSAVARETDSVGLGTAVHLPALRNPVTLAHVTATLDQLSGGRFHYGVGVGTGSDVAAEYANLGVDYDSRGDRLDETLEVLSALWAGEPVDHEGAFFDLDGASIGFSPARTPPIYVSSATFDHERGFPRPIRERIAARADGWLPIGHGPETYAAGLERARELVAEAGRDASALDPAFYFDVVIDADERAALDEARDFMHRYYPGLSDLPDEFFEGRGAFGPADTVEETLSAYGDAGVETAVVRFPARNQREQLSRFASMLA